MSIALIIWGSWARLPPVTAQSYLADNEQIQYLLETGHQLLRNNQPAAALETYQQVRQLYEANNDPIGLISVWHRIGQTYHALL
ncbi:MAG: hypothetical protein AAFY17_03795, partial [Cyanobacteria bacterium J06642_11]